MARRWAGWVWTCLRQGLLWVVFINPAGLLAAGWPWSKEPDQITATCLVEPAQVEQGSALRLKAKVEAADTKKHPLAYVWSGNGGQILGSGAEVELDASNLNPGVYSLAAAVQDAYKNRADCITHFQVIVPANTLTARCTVEPQEAEPGASVRARAEATDRLGQTLRYRWFANGGVLLPEGSEAQIQTAEMAPGEYTVTGRVEDEWGHATDCSAMLRIVLPPPPPIAPELLNLAQIVFPRNVAQLGEPERQQLQKVLDRLEQDPAGIVSIESYAGPDENNPQTLAEARAAAVKHLLLERGVRAERVQTMVGLGGRLGGVRNRTLDVIWIPQGMEY
ncbi:MAG: OmpA family protein [Acidobacteria bacterium]|nr:OmpA family protein [Acidobacteriota bacterium]